MTAPVMSIAYDNNAVLNLDHYNANRVATLTVVEHNFRASDVVLESLTAKDIKGNDIVLTRDYQELLRYGEWIHEGDTHKLDIPFDVDARYTFEISYSDLAQNHAEENVSDEFCIDKCAPDTDSLKISYSTSVVDLILQGITFGFYKAPATVTVESDDDISGIDYFTYSYNVSSGESSTNKGANSVMIPAGNITYSDGGKHSAAVFEIPAQFRGNVSFTSTDRSGNTSAEFRDDKVIVVDDVSGVISVAYDNNDASYDTFYKAPRTAEITIDEANFFAEAFGKNYDVSKDPSTEINEHLVITVTKEKNDGTLTTTVYKNEDLTSPFEKISEDTWRATLLFAEDADYSFKIEYTDFSGNVAEAYSDAFTVDNINPRIAVSYDNNSAKNGKYFAADREMTITVTEHNFNMGIVPMDEKVIVRCRDGSSFEIRANRNELQTLLQGVYQFSPDLIVGYGRNQMEQYSLIVKNYSEQK